MSGRPWIKVFSDMFDHDKILLIEDLPDCDTILVIWFKLMCWAGKKDNDGIFAINGVPYSDQMWRKILGRTEETIGNALRELLRNDLICVTENGTYFIKNWDKRQANWKSKDAEKQQRYRDREREKKRLQEAKKADKKVKKEQKKTAISEFEDEEVTRYDDVTVTVTDSVTSLVTSPVTVTESNMLHRRKKIEEDIDIRNRVDITDVISPPATANAHANDERPKPPPPLCAIAPADKSGVYITIPLKDGRDYPITNSKVSEWKQTFDLIDVDNMFKTIRQWNIDNPNKRKTKAGLLRHVSGWLAEANNEERMRKTQRAPAIAPPLRSRIEYRNGEEVTVFEQSP